MSYSIHEWWEDTIKPLKKNDIIDYDKVIARFQEAIYGWDERSTRNLCRFIHALLTLLGGQETIEAGFKELGHHTSDFDVEGDGLFLIRTVDSISTIVGKLPPGWALLIKEKGEPTDEV